MICTTEEIPSLLANAVPRVVGLTSGCYDLLHYYHLHYLERAAAECDFLIVGVDADALIQINKGKSPVIPEYHRTAMVAALSCVDVAFTMRSVADVTFLSRFVNRLFRNAPTVYGQPIVPVGDVELVIIPDVEEVQSTTKIIEKIRAGEKKGDLSFRKLDGEEVTVQFIECGKCKGRSYGQVEICPSCGHRLGQQQ